MVKPTEITPSITTDVTVGSVGITGPPSVVKTGKVIRADAIPEGSKLEFVAPGRVKFDGIEFRAVRDLGHVSEERLMLMLEDGRVAKDIFGQKLHGHHHKQQYHREPGAFIVEIPENMHKIGKQNQHPLGNKGGLTETERTDWNKLRKQYWQERANTELLKRGIKIDE